MNDIRFDDRGAGRSGASCRSCGCGGGGSRSAARKKRDEMIVLASSVVVCFGAMGVAIGGGKPKGGDGGASSAAVSAAARDGGGGGESGGGAAEAREHMEADGSKMVKPSLIFSEKTKLPGAGADSLGTLAVAFDIEKEWHTYWRNAGDSGMPPTFEFTVEPAGAVEIGEAQWPVPERHLGAGDILDYIYEGRVLHLFEVRAGKGSVGKGDVTITCKMSWLVCKEACLPGEGEAKTTFSLTNRQQPESAADKEIRDQVSRLPAASGGAVKVEWKDGVLSIASAGGSPTPMAFFPFADEGDLVPVNLVSGGESKSGRLRLRFEDGEAVSGKRVRGVLRVGASGDKQSGAYLLETTVP